MNYKSWDGKRDVELKPCPCCGYDEVRLKYIGNDRTRKRYVEITCNNCRLTRKDGAVRFGFEWLENIASKAWNRRETR